VNERGFEGQPGSGAEGGHKPFRILITIGGPGFSMQCKAGCAWTSLTHRCGQQDTCTTTVDKDGVRGADAPTE
jgi:hypothetical protein